MKQLHPARPRGRFKIRVKDTGEKQWNAILSLLLGLATIALYMPVSGHAFLTFDDHDYVTANPRIHDGLSWNTEISILVTLETVELPMRRKRKSKSVPGRTGAFSAAKLSAAKKWNVLFCLLLAGAAFALYSPVIGHSFMVLDDRDYVTANAHIHQGLTWKTIKWAFTSTAAANWHPLTWLSHALDYQLFALNPAGHHLDSVLIHAANAVLLFLLLASITKRVGPSLLVAALFALHPINVESVAWVAERKNLLSTLFFFLAIGAYAWYAQKPDWRRYLLVAGLFAAGLMAKPMVITFPCVLLLLDYWPLGRTDGSPSAFFVRGPHWAMSKPLLEKIPLFLLSAASAWITLKAQQSGQAVRSLHQFPLAVRIENALVAYGLYLWKMLWPAHLALYPHPATALPAWQWILSALVLLGVTAFVILFRHKRYLAVGWFWFLGTLVPVIGLVQVGEASMADRYAYIPLIGIFIMIAWGFADLAQEKQARPVWRMIPALCALTALGFVTHNQIGYWNSDYDLWAHVLAINERSPFAHDAMGSALLDSDLVMTADSAENLDTPQKRMEAARQHFDQALQLRRELAQHNPAAYLPDMATTLNNLGNLDRLENLTGQAREHYQEALQIHRQLARQNLDPYPPDLATTLNNLGYLENSGMQLQESRQHFEEALGIYRKLAQQTPDQYLPKVAETLNNLGFVAREQNQTNEARLHYEEALKIRRHLVGQDADTYLPYLATTLNDSGILDAAQNRTDDARLNYEEALKSYRQLAQQDRDTYLPYVAATLNNLALADERQNRMDDARAHLSEDLTIYRELAQGDSDRYSGDVARVEAGLEELTAKAPSK
jgi:protein O-mannosyl-transferase